MTVPVLVFGQGLTLLGVVRCFGRAGIPLQVCTETDPLPRSSRYFGSRLGPVLRQSAIDELSDFLGAIRFERAVLIPCSDPWAHAVASLPRDLQQRFPTVVAAPEVVETLIDKGRFRRLLENAHVPHPRTFDVTRPADLDDVPDSALQNGFLKPCEDYTGATIDWIDLAQDRYNRRLQQAIATGTVHWDIMEIGAPLIALM